MSTASVFASGPRLDYPEDGDATEIVNDCWVNGYDSGFAGKYDSERAIECYEGGDAYNSSWDGACEDATRTEKECNEIMNNTVEIQDYEELINEINVACRNDGTEDAEADKPFNKDRDTGCDEFDDQYGDAYKAACESYNTESVCALIMTGEKNYCPDHPDIVACVDFLHNATNKQTENPYSVCAGMGDPRPNIICPQEINPEKYCLMHDNPYCKIVGDLCDGDGFVRPEYPYCKQN